MSSRKRKAPCPRQLSPEEVEILTWSYRKDHGFYEYGMLRWIPLNLIMASLRRALFVMILRFHLVILYTRFFLWITVDTHAF